MTRDQPAPISQAFEVRKPLVLLVEEDASLRAVVCEVLARDANVLATGDGAQALELARRHRPDAIVSDLPRPIRTDPHLRRVPLLVLTALAGVEARISALDAGADDCMSKPVHEGELRARVRSLIRARRRIAPDELTSTFRREGDCWTLSWSGTVTRIRHSKGAHYLARLLERPHTEVHVLDLCAQVPDSSPPPAELTTGFHVGDARDAGALLDARAKQAYRARLIVLRDELEEARDYNDMGRTERARAEMDALTAELSAAVGLGGRDRKACAAERARINVTRTIKAVLDRITAGHRDLGAHLTHSVRTGTYCSYSPAPGVPSEWVVEY